MLLLPRSSAILARTKESDKLLTAEVRRRRRGERGREERTLGKEGRAFIHLGEEEGEPERENREIGDGGDDATGMVCRT
jgi:hypothetical protein